MKTLILCLIMGALGCGDAFQNAVDDSKVSDADGGAIEVDAGPAPPGDIRADMLADASDTLEASTDGGLSDVPQDGEAGDSVPTCGDDEVYPQASPTCAKWIAMSDWPLEKGCCRRETHTCGHVVTFSPFCVQLR